MTRAQVLAVDDERFFREAIVETLETDGLRVVTAASGEEALELGMDPAMGVVVLDLQLPDLHGLEVFRRLKAVRSDLRVIILSAHTDQENVLEALRLGAFDYLAKPLHEEELRLSVKRALETHDLHRGWTRLRTRLERLDGCLEDLRLHSALSQDASIEQDWRHWAVNAAADVLGAAKTSLMVLDGVSHELKVAAVRGRKVQPHEMDRVAVGEGLAGHVFARGEALVVQNFHEDERFAGREQESRYDTGSCVLAPVGLGMQAHGVLCAADPADGAAFGDEDLRMLRILADQLAQVLGAATENQLADSGPRAEERGEPNAISARVAAIAQAICDAQTREVEPDRVLALALRSIGEAIQAAPVSIYLRDALGDVVREAEWDGGYRSDRARLLPGGIAGAVLAGSSLVATGNPTGDPRFDAAIDTSEEGQPRPLICVPLQFRGKVLGLARAFPERPEDASPEIAEMLAAALSATVRNVLLYRNLVATIDEVAEARRNARA